MDCNRDEAARSRGIAEKKFMQHDYAGARKFALKARQLFPDLEGLLQFIAVVDVHVTAHERLQCGEMNWYGILQSDPSADEASLRKQYRKLALVLHPDKNKSLGAEAAFKFISEAWTILSDKSKKAAYDSKTAPTTSKAAPPKKSRPVPQKKQTEKPPPPACQPQPPQQTHSPVLTFWTACPDCKLQYEYHIIYKNRKLCCPFCLKPFLARELSAIIDGPVIWPPLQEQNRTNADARGAPFHANGHSNGAKFCSSNGNVPVFHSTKSQVNPEARKENIGVHVPFVSKEHVKSEMDLSKTKLRAEAEAYNPVGAKPNVVMEQSSPDKPPKEGSKGAVNAGTIETPKVSTTEEHIAPDQKAGVSMNMPSVELEVQLNVSPSKKARVDFKGSVREQVMKGDLKTRLSEMGVNKENGDHCMPSDFKVKASKSNVEPSDHESDKFNPRQLWACYDDDDGFPRYYARVVKVMSRKPFKIQYTWLEARNSSEEVMSWVDSGFSYTCGEFKLGKTLMGDSVCMFSHVMTFEKGQKAGFKIFPRKGEVWALYKEWATLKTKDEKHGYDLVEVLTDYSDEDGVQVCALVKVEGYKSVFQQQYGVVDRVLPAHMRRFSHNVPVHRLVAGEVPECIEGFLELDPASTPIN
eukprot:c19723_g1_i2 orf=502-2415(+)